MNTDSMGHCPAYPHQASLGAQQVGDSPEFWVDRWCRVLVDDWHDTADQTEGGTSRTEIMLGCLCRLFLTVPGCLLAAGTFLSALFLHALMSGAMMAFLFLLALILMQTGETLAWQVGRIRLIMIGYYANCGFLLGYVWCFCSGVFAR